MKLKSCLLILLLVSIVNTIIQAKDINGLDTIRIDTTKLYVKLNRTGFYYQDDTHTIKPEQLAGIHFIDTIPFQLKITPKLVQKDFFLKFAVTNQADTIIDFYFSPGIYFEEIKLYQLDQSGKGVAALNRYPDEINGFKKMELGSHQAATYFVKLKFIRTTTNTFTPVLVRDYYKNSYIITYQNSDRSGNIITFVFSGILLMMIFYSIAVYLLNRNAEFIYYAGYAFCLGLMLFLKSYIFRTPSSFNNFFEAYLDFVLQSAGTFIYLAFLRKFIDTKKNFPLLHKLMLAEQRIIIASIGLFSYLYFNTDKYIWQNYVEITSKVLWIAGAIIFVIYTVNKKNEILNYLAVGHSFLIVGGLVSMYLISSPGSITFRDRYPGPLSNALTYYEIGLVIELMFFLTALALKNKTDIVLRTKEGERLRLKTEMQDFEKQLAVLSAQQDERNRISADMHDELGSGVTHIRLMSEIVKAKMKDKVFPEIDKISHSANELIIKMNTLIWTMKSENDSVESLITYIRIYSLEFFENTAINCVVEIPSSFPNIELSGVKRRNLFLSVKESLNNVLKHSKADRVIISFRIDTNLIISITDNGVGIDHNNLRRFGSGLSNIKKRIEGIDGSYKIENNTGGGAETTLELNL
jgi:signal transduction histidine kinase